MASRESSSSRRALLPTLPPAVSEARLVVGQMAIVATLVGWLGFVAVTLAKTSRGNPDDPTFGVSTVAYLALISVLAFSALAYLTARLGFFYRARAHRRAVRGTVVLSLEHEPPAVSIIVPSLQEEAQVVRRTLLSAALQEYPALDVVLLIDDPPVPEYAAPAKLLHEARRLPQQVESLLAGPSARFRAARARFEAGSPADAGAHGLGALAKEYEYAVAWLERLADDYPNVDGAEGGSLADQVLRKRNAGRHGARPQEPVTDHADAFLCDQIIRRLAADLRETAQALRTAAGDGATLSRSHVQHLYRRLDWIFTARLTSFERKRYASLSHEPNKATNLNSYIGLMGGRFRDVSTPAGRALVPAEHDADLVVADPDYVLTLDADSVLLPEYCLRMVHELEQGQHRDVAVAQTPYSAFPGPATRLERIAGATTDLQHIIHQGLTYYDATFWVGANALLRKRALDELCETDHVGNFEIRRYIKSRTVIEDTESSVHLRTRTWQLLNYPERMSYSATPPDFGSLSIQRQRWANGGLLIIPVLWRQMRGARRRGEPLRPGETLLRLNYMGSIAWSTFAVLFLLFYLFDGQLLSPLLALVSLPYLAMVASDLRFCGYRRIDVLGVYGFNLVLLPVNLAGVGRSIMQALVGAKTAFRRTPKVRGRTTPALLFVVTPYALVAFSIFTLVLAYEDKHWVNAAVAGLNAVLATYAIVAFIGVRRSIVDIWQNIRSWLHKPAPQAVARPATAQASAGDWASILRYGDFDAPAAGRPDAP